MQRARAVELLTCIRIIKLLKNGGENSFMPLVSVQRSAAQIDGATSDLTGRLPPHCTQSHASTSCLGPNVTKTDDKRSNLFIFATQIHHSFSYATKTIGMTSWQITSDNWKCSKFKTFVSTFYIYKTKNGCICLLLIIYVLFTSSVN